ncbi:nuclear transport factor 2 family protein [Gracilimonas sp.]|uniref:nuclear transport factor 2 family protein n=1 Tax=Gracilimonas sp. TaxID=1974203 RepID=UPI002872A6E5|nr:nuclear transport factor 2 family protein [Gracilimonas sp.]
MKKHEEVIRKLYLGLQKLNAEKMAACYHEEATFRDPVFDLKSKREIAGMWAMLSSRAKKFELTFDSIEADEKSGSAYVEAQYLFSSTGRMVHNKIEANFNFKDGLIIKQVDSFDFWRWSRYALGLPGYLLGWSSLLQNKVRKEAGENLGIFLDS